MDDKLEKINRLLESEEDFIKYIENIEEQKIKIPEGLNKKVFNNIKIIDKIGRPIEKNTTVKLTKSKRL